MTRLPTRGESRNIAVDQYLCCATCQARREKTVKQRVRPCHRVNSGFGRSAKEGHCVALPACVHQRKLVHPVVAHLVTLNNPFVNGDNGVAGHPAGPTRIQVRTDNLTANLARH
jgi:hypothetical protein